MGLTRPRSLQVTQRDAALLPSLHRLTAEPPFWGSRSRWADLRVVEKRPVNTKRSLRLMQEPPLVATPHVKRKAKRTPARGKPRPTEPKEWRGSAMTQVMGEGLGRVDMVLVLDWSTTQAVGS